MLKDSFIAAANSFGVTVRFVSREDYSLYPLASDFLEAPFTEGVGIFHGRKHILIREASEYTPSMICSWIHELGHLVATKDHPQICEEGSFVGWEYSLALSLGITQEEWVKGNGAYYVGYEEYSELGGLPQEYLPGFLAAIVEEATRGGLISSDGNLQTLR